MPHSTQNIQTDRSVRDARWHIEHERSEGGEYLVSHIIEWGSGHYDWSDNATYMLTKYITKAIEARLPADYAITGQLNDLDRITAVQARTTRKLLSGSLMKNLQTK